MDKTGWFCETGSEAHTLEKAFIKAYNGNIFPATKEQRELLFSKMKEAGYEWDANHKQLKKIEQKPAWSEEDEEILQWVISDVKRLDNDCKKANAISAKELTWLKALRPQNTWKPSDKQISLLQAIVNDPNNAASESCQIALKEVIRQLKKLKGE
jgi:DNA repair ATPase RecN